MADPEDSGARLGRKARTAPALNGATLSEQIHRLLEEAIIHGEITPSSRLHADDIAAEYGVSRIPVREALRSLHEAGWVEIKPRHGVYVRARSMTELRELFEARSGLEGEIARLAAERRTPEDVEHLRGALERGRAAAESQDLNGLAQASIAFNSTLREACRNRVLAGLSTTLEERARFYFAMVEGRLGPDWLTIEQKLLEKIETGDGEAAAKIARKHISNTGKEVSKLLEAE